MHQAGLHNESVNWRSACPRFSSAFRSAYEGIRAFQACMKQIVAVYHGSPPMAYWFGIRCLSNPAMGGFFCPGGSDLFVYVSPGLAALQANDQDETIRNLHSGKAVRKTDAANSRLDFPKKNPSAPFPESGVIFFT